MCVGQVYKASLADDDVQAVEPKTAPVQLQWKIDAALAATIRDAGAAFDSWTDTLQVCIAKTPKVTTADAKAHKVSSVNGSERDAE